MYLKTLTLRGFKTFADKTTIEFNPSGGIVAIVGPNGCGKSNVVDAIRWVLGEQSLKEVRSASLEDIIFAGTAGRKSLSLAEATLVLDNSDRFLASEYTEVSIKRRVFRSGESEFFLNKNPCRLKDIRDLFMDTGLGRGAYSIINQGQVDAILSSKPDERRAPFEEAAQISKYRFRKEAAARKLIATEQNLLRVNDIKGELSSQLSVLELQAAKAREYKDTKNRLKELEIGLCKKLLQSLNERKVSQTEKIQKLRDELALSQTQFLQIEDDRQKIKENLKAQEADIEAAILSIENKIASIEKARRDLEIEEEREKNLSEQLASYEKEAEDLGKQAAGYREKLSEKEKNKEEKSARLSAKEGALSETKEKLGGVLSFGEDLEKKIENAKSGVFQKEIALTEFNNKLIELEGSNRFAKEELRRDERQRGKLEQEIESSGQALKEVEKRSSGEQAELARLTRLLEERSIERRGLEFSQAAKDDALSSLKEDLSTKASKLSFLRGMYEEHQGFGEGVREVIKLTQGQGGRSKVLGVLADLIKSDELYELAIEAALGQSLQLIITKTDSAAKELIEHLRKENTGRAAFLPINLIKASEPLSSEALSRVPGFKGIASSFASCADEIRAAKDFLLGRTLVFDNLEHAISFFRSDKYSRGLRITTLTGELINQAGIITGGAPSKKAAVSLGREREMLAAASAAEEAKKKVEEASSSLIKIKAALSSAEKEVGSLSQEKHSLELAAAGSRHESDSLKEAIVSKKEELSLILQGSAARETEVADISKEKEATLSAVEEAKKERAELESQLKGLMESSTNTAKEREGTSNEVTELRVESLRLAHDLKALEEEISILKESIDRIDGILKAKAELALKTKLETSKKTIEDLRAVLPKLEDERGLLEKTQKEKKEAKVSLAAEIETFEGKIRGAEDSERALRDKLSKEEVVFGKVEAEMGVLSQTLTEEYALTIEEILASSFEVSNQAKAKEDVRSLKDALKALGDVNLLAIEEFERSKERLSFIETQFKDLTDARESLKSLVIQLDEKARESFRETIRVVSENFSKIFADLFEGGEAKLMLIEGLDILDAGIEIIARPSGKKWLSLELLSGGERALTAIAILFALLKTHPSPFCFLDEVDAALDDANIGRFGKMLKHFAVDTQMVVITHSKRTMSAADVLYGVTMEDPGVSKIISMKLAEVA